MAAAQINTVMSGQKYEDTEKVNCTDKEQQLVVLTYLKRIHRCQILVRGNKYISCMPREFTSCLTIQYQMPGPIRVRNIKRLDLLSRVRLGMVVLNSAEDTDRNDSSGQTGVN